MVVQDRPNFRDVTQGESGSTDRKQRLRERFEVVKKLGQGTYGKVQLAVNKETKQEVAIKTIKKAKIENEQDLVRIRREIQIMSSIHHPHIIHIYEVFENPEKIVLIMQYASGGELYDYLGCRKKLEENEARRVFRQVASAIFYCHKNRICHRDLKLENILLDDRGNAKIADFGLSNVFDEKFKLKTFCGSPLYASPEIVRGKPYSGPEVDCWSLGVLLYTLVYGAMPFDGSNFKRLVKQISEGEYFEPKEKSGASGLIRRLLTVDTNHRATIRDICSDWWVNQGYDHSLLKVAGDLANLTPVRLDLLVALSSSNSQVADQPQKQQQPITSSLPEDSKSLLCNGYYSKSHPLCSPENGANRKRTVTEATNHCEVHSDPVVEDARRQHVSRAVVYEKACEDKLARRGDKQEHLLAGNAKKMATNQTTASVKNESNTLIIVQDLIKEVISKVEQNVNICKMEALKGATTRQTQQKDKDCGFSAAAAYGKSRIADNSMDCEELKNKTLQAEQKSMLLQTLSQRTNRNSSLLQSMGTTASEIKTTSQNVQYSDRKAVEISEMAGFSNGATDVKKTVLEEKKTISETEKGIPHKAYDFQRKTAIKLMEPDVVIPIFNVCCNIPKRSQDFARQTSRDPTPSDGFQSTPRRLSETHSKIVNSGMKSDDQHLPNTENLGTLDSSPSKTDTDIVPTGPRKGFPRQTPAGSTNESDGSDVKQASSATEPPKLPPRKRFLVRIPKQEQSKENGVIPVEKKSGNPEKPDSGDKQEKDVSQEESRGPTGDEKQELQTPEKGGSEAPMLDQEEEKTFSNSEQDDAALIQCKPPDRESSPKLSQRKSRRDSSKRSQLFNTKRDLNRESNHDVLGKQNSCEDKSEHPEVVSNVSSKELHNLDAPNRKQEEIGETAEDLTQLPEAQVDQGNSVLKDYINTFPSRERESLNSEECSEMWAWEMRTEMSEKETKDIIDLLARHCDLGANERDDAQITETRYFSDVKDASATGKQGTATGSKRAAKSKQRSLSRTRAMSLEFESLALMPVRVVRPPKKPPGKVEIPKSFDPTQPVTSPKPEMREIIFIPTACVSENKDKIQKKIEKVRRSAIVMPPRRKSETGFVRKKKRYTGSKTDFIPRSGDQIFSSEGENLATEAMSGETAYPEDIDQNEEAEDMDEEEETVPNDMWYSAVSPDSELEECEQGIKGSEDRVECGENFDGFYGGNGAATAQNNHRYRHSVDAESGYWTPPEMAAGDHHSGIQTNGKAKDERIPKRCDHSEKIMLQRAAFRNSKLRMKLSDEGLDVCSLSSSLESGIYSWRQEDMNGKGISPDSESVLKVLKQAEMVSDGSYAPIARSFKKMTFSQQHSSTSELSENCPTLGETERNMSIESAAFEKYSRMSQSMKHSRADSKPIKPSDSQSSYGSNDISDDVFDNWVEKEDVLVSKGKSGLPEDAKMARNCGRSKQNRNWQRDAEKWNSCSTDKESSDNDDDLDLMIEESQQIAYGTEGLWQFLKSVNSHLSNELKAATQKVSSKPACHRSKSQESKHPDDAVSQRRPVTRSLSREERQRKGGTELRHFVSEGKLADADSIDCFEDSYKRFNDTRYSSGYMASGSSIGDSGLLNKDFMSSVDSFHNHSDDVSVYGTLRRDKYFHSSSALSSPCVRRKSLQNPGLCNNAESIAYDALAKNSTTAEQNRKLSLYGTLRSKHLSQQGRAQSQILLSTDDGYQLLYNERLKKDPEARHGNLGSSAIKASSDFNVSVRENQPKDYEKLLLADRDEDLRRTLGSSVVHRNASTDLPTSRVKKIVSDKGMRRVSFSSDVKAPKSDYHSTIRLNTLNKVREASEELLSSSNRKNNVYDDEPDGGSLLEALKMYGYKGIMSQKLQSSPDRHEPRMSYRLPTECFLSSGLNATGWEDVEFVPLDTALAYQQSLYSPIEPMEYYHCKTFTKGAHTKRNLAEFSDLPLCDENAIFKDVLRSHRLGESEAVTRRKPAHKHQDLSEVHLTHGDRYAGETRNTKQKNSARKKSSDGSAVLLSSERRNSDSGKSVQREKEGDETGPAASTELSESLGSKQNENPMEILSEKIQALKSRCQRKSLDESRLKKELEDSGILTNGDQDSERTATLDLQSERLSCYADSAETLSSQDSESTESVSDRIWRKSFYPRFNDASTVRRKKPSLLDSEYLSAHGLLLRNAGKFNIDEEGGVEEPWLNTSIKRRNSNYSRSVPRQTMTRAYSQESEAKLNQADFSPQYQKRGLFESELKEVRSMIQSKVGKTGKSTVCDKIPVNLARGEIESARKLGSCESSASQRGSSSDCIVVPQESKNDSTELTNSYVKNKSNSTEAPPILSTTGSTEVSEIRPEPSANTLKGGENIPDTKPDLTSDISNVSNGNGNCKSEVSSPEVKNETPSQEDLVTTLGKTSLEESLEIPRTEDNCTEPASSKDNDSQEQCERPEADKE